MPRKRRTTNAEKAPKLWIAPEWTARLRESRSPLALGSDFSRYLDLADRALAKEAKANAHESAEASQHELVVQGGDNGNGHAPEIMSEALLGAAAPKVSLPKPPKRPTYPKPRKVMMSKPRATPRLQKPRSINFPKPPSRNW